MVDFLAIGAQKCATSWLYYCLKEHPELYLPEKKREAAYIGGELFHKNGIDWYLEPFCEDTEKKIKGDFSVEYLFGSQSPKLIKQHLGDNLKFIVSLRNPIDRAVSAYYWYQRWSKISEGVSLEMALNKGLQAYKEANTESIYYDLVARGMYHQQLESYFEYFPKENFYFILFEDINEASVSVLKKVYRFLEVSDEFVPTSINKKPKKNSYSPLLLSLENRMKNNRITAGVIDRLHQYISKLNKNSNKKQISSNLELDLKELYQEDMEKTSKLLNSLPANQHTNEEDNIMEGLTDRGV